MKRRLRYNWDTGKWVERYRFTTDVAVILPFINPQTGLRKVITLPHDSPMVECYRRLYDTPKRRTSPANH